MNRNIGTHIKQLRLSNSMTQEDLALRLNVTRQNISSWEVGNSAVSTEYLADLSEIFGVSIEEIIYGCDANTPYKRHQKKYQIVVIACVAVLLLGLILTIAVTPWFQGYSHEHPRSIAYLCYQFVLIAFLSVAAGAVIPAIISLFGDIRIFGRSRYLALAAAVFLLLLELWLFFAAFSGLLIPAGGVLRWLYMAAITHLDKTETTITFFVGTLGFLGLNFSKKQKRKIED